MPLVANIFPLFACLLLAAGVVAALGTPFGALRAALLLVAASSGLVAPRRSVLAVVAAAPLLPVVSRVWMGKSNLSLAEHLVVGVLAGGLLRASADRRTGTAAIDRALLVYVAVVLASFAGVMLQYAHLGADPLAIIRESANRYFVPAFADFGQEPFLVVRDTLVVLVGAQWWYLITSRSLRIDAEGLQRAISAGLIGSCLVAVAQWHWQFGEVPALGQTHDVLFRLTGSWHDNNIFACYLLLAGPLAIVRSWQKRRGGLQAAAVAFLLAFALLGSGSRTGWLAAGAAGMAALVVLLANDAALGVELTRRARFRLGGGVALAGVLVAGTFAVATTLDAGRALTQPRVTSLGELMLFSANLRRPTDELLSHRNLYWRAAVSIWTADPILGCGIGRYRALKTRPAQEILAAGDGTSSGAIEVVQSVFGTSLVSASNVDFERSDVVPGDTIESRDGGWGPTAIRRRRSATALELDQTVPSGSGLDFIIRHPEFHPEWRFHKHQSPLPFFTTAHNQYLQILSELGLLGLSAFVLLAAAIGLQISRTARRVDAPARQRIAGAAIGLAGLFLCCITQDPLIVREMHVVFWSVVAAALAEGWNERGLLTSTGLRRGQRDAPDRAGEPA